jgi:RNA polymerase sigma-70 factor (ECF subfamily)
MVDERGLEDALIRSAAAGNEGAFSQLVRAYRLQVVRTAYGILGSVTEADDVAQEAFIKAWESLPDLRQRSTFRTWLFRITVNTAIDAVRRRRPEPPLDETMSGEYEAPEEATIRRDIRERVQAAIRDLPPAARATLILREYEQLSYREIAAVLEIPIGTVMSRLSYARQLLRERLTADDR